MSSTQPTFFQQTNQGFGVTNLEGLDGEQLKERLLVAETIMKKLYTRNKELEDYHQHQQHHFADNQSSQERMLKFQASGSEDGGDTSM
mmetsp:Transcript_20444/g.27629  ORF Transcript_20444/g.27629 Transcript_20444/m.27629 type:complete len:88 (+) Transcript_20444:1356-1619(+)